MPLMLNENGALARGEPQKDWGLPTPRDRDFAQTECIHIALINNMPDAALEDTELQFLDLLNAAAGSIPVCVQLYSLPEITRSERVQQHMSGLYASVRDLPSSRFDAVIITGTEPHHPDLREEAYWATLTDLFDWAADNTTSTILSCLAAHASVLHSDGIERHLLNDKRFGVFDERRVSDHPLTAGSWDVIRIPHSRWNELPENELDSCGYVALTRSQEAGLGLFMKQKRKSLFIHVQGHPEYAAQTLLKEYRRDIKRFLKRERESYPSLPHGYFSAPAVKLLAEFRERALLDPHEDVLATFPVFANTMQNGWHTAAAGIYRNWLHYLTSRKANSPGQHHGNANAYNSRRRF
jgi:homoserine O-succinyltransferase